MELKANVEQLRLTATEMRDLRLQEAERQKMRSQLIMV